MNFNITKVAVNKRDIIMRYAVVVCLLAFVGICVVIKAGIIMFKERGYWQEVAARFVRENVSVPSNRGNILSSDGKPTRSARQRNRHARTRCSMLT